MAYHNGYYLGTELQKALNLPPFAQIKVNVRVKGVVNATVRIPLTDDQHIQIGNPPIAHNKKWFIVDDYRDSIVKLLRLPPVERLALTNNGGRLEALAKFPLTTEQLAALGNVFVGCAKNCKDS